MLESDPIINCCVRRTSRDTSRVAFEIANPIGKQATLEVWRIRRDGKTFVPTPEGLILKSEIRRRTVVVAIVGIGDLVVLRAKNPFENATQYQLLPDRRGVLTITRGYRRQPPQNRGHSLPDRPHSSRRRPANPVSSTRTAKVLCGEKSSLDTGPD